jgi:tetratricopeptide (TPR) repeat protein
LGDDLRRWLDGRSVQARPSTSTEKFFAWVRRNPGLAASITLAILGLSIGLSVAVWQRNRALENLVEAERQRQRADTNLIEAQNSLQESQRQTERANQNLATAQSMINDIVDLEKQLRHQNSFGELRKRVVVRAAELQMDLLDQEFNDPKLKYDSAIVLKELSPLLIQLGEIDLAIVNIDRVLNLLEDFQPDTLPTSVAYQNVYATRIGQRLNLVGIYQQRGDFELGLEMLAANRLERLPDNIPRPRAQVILAENFRGEADFYRQLGNAAKAAAALEQGLAALDSVEVPNTPNNQWDFGLTRCRLHTGLSIHRQDLGDGAAANTHLLAATAEIPKLKELLPNSPFLFEIQSQLALAKAHVHFTNLEWASAADAFREGQEFILQLHQANPDFPQHAVTYLMIAEKVLQTLIKNKDWDQVTVEVQRVLEQIDHFTTKFQGFEAFDRAVENFQSMMATATQAAREQKTDESP